MKKLYEIDTDGLPTLMPSYLTYGKVEEEKDIEQYEYNPHSYR